MRISDWSSDVCSSDLLARGFAEHPGGGAVLAACLGAVADRERIVAGGARRREAAGAVAVHGDRADRGIELAELDRRGGCGAVGEVADAALARRGAVRAGVRLNLDRRPEESSVGKEDV